MRKLSTFQNIALRGARRLGVFIQQVELSTRVSVWDILVSLVLNGLPRASSRATEEGQTRFEPACFEKDEVFDRIGCCDEMYYDARMRYCEREHDA